MSQRALNVGLYLSNIQEPFPRGSRSTNLAVSRKEEGRAIAASQNIISDDFEEPLLSLAKILSPSFRTGSERATSEDRDSQAKIIAQLVHVSWSRLEDTFLKKNYGCSAHNSSC